MKTQNKNLAFNKSSVVDLNDNQLMDVNGGTSPLCVGIIISLLITRE
ncbi:class IIb bacteriocin, lactobin A/cerein 7B family [Lacinutrix sp. Hel_I_90]|nr:class IIb bacteriocin, lactobin A/cerein 7B family [Lacinutrix sp. Hel_I_90]